MALRRLTQALVAYPTTIRQSTSHGSTLQGVVIPSLCEFSSSSLQFNISDPLVPSYTQFTAHGSRHNGISAVSEPGTGKESRKKIYTSPLVRHQQRIRRPSALIVACYTTTLNVDPESKEVKTKLNPSNSALRRRRRLFQQMVKERNLHTGIDPSELADKISSLRSRDVHYQSVGMHAMKWIRSTTDQAYHDKYYARSQQVRRYISDALRLIRKNPQYSHLDDKEKKRMAFAKMQTMLSNPPSQPKPFTRIHSPRSTATRQTVLEIGGRVRNMLKSKGLAFESISLGDLLEEADELASAVDMKKAYYTKCVFCYVRLNRSDSTEDWAAVIRKRYAALRVKRYWAGERDRVMEQRRRGKT